MGPAPTNAGMLTPGALFHGRYQVEHCLKAGGMGAVWVVVDRNTQRHRALKTMLPAALTDPGLRDRFKH